MKITDQVWEFAEPLVQACGCSLWDVEYVREGGEWFLRLYRLVRYEDGAVTIEMRGREVTFDKAEVALVRLRVEF